MKKTRILTEIGEFGGEPLDEGRVPGHHIPGWMQEVELYWLHEQAKQYDTVVEIGAWKGRASYALASGIRGVAYCCDHYGGGANGKVSVNACKKAKKEFMANLKEFMDAGKCCLLHMQSLEAASRCDMRVDMVFIDGAHDEESVNSDILAWLPNCKILMCGHDYDMEGVRNAVDSIFGKNVRNGFGNIWYVEIGRGAGNVS